MYPSLEIAQAMLALFGSRPHMTHAPRPYTHLSRDDLAAYVEWESAHRARSARPRPVQAPLAQSGQTPGDADSPEPTAAGSAGPGDTSLPVLRRRTPVRLRVAFLHHYRTCGEVKLAAAQIGVSLSTLYRWRERDAAFRRRWESLARQRRQMAEDRLMSVIRNGEKTSVFYKGRMVGWRQSFTARAALAALNYFDRREKAQAKAREKAWPAPSDAVDEVGDRPARQTCAGPGAVHSREVTKPARHGGDSAALALADAPATRHRKAALPDAFEKRAGRVRPGKVAQQVGWPAVQAESGFRPAAASGHMSGIAGNRRDADAGGNRHRGEPTGHGAPEDSRQTSARHALQDAGPAAGAAIGCERFVAGDRAIWHGPAHRFDGARVDQRMIVARPSEVGAVLPPPTAGDDP